MLKDPQSECYYPAGLGTPSEETVPLVWDELHTDWRCDFELPSDYNRAFEPRRYICAKGIRCINSGGSKAQKVNGDMFFLADGGVDNRLSGSLEGSTLESMGTMGLYDTAYETLKKCQDAHPNRVVGNIYGAVVPPEVFPDVASCRTKFLAETGNRAKTSDLASDGGCYFMYPGKAYDAGRLAPKKEAKCSCYFGGTFFRNADNVSFFDIFKTWGGLKVSWSLIKGEFTEISIHYGTDPWFLGTPNMRMQTYKNGATIDENIAACEAAHPDRYYSSFSGSCFTTLDACKEDVKTQCDGHNGEYYFNNNYYAKITDAVNAATRCTAGQSCLITTGIKNVKRCDCSVAYNPNYSYVLCSSGQAGSAVGVDCSEKCKLIPVSAAGIQPIFPKSPLAIINVIVNLLFWFAVMLLILNFITAGIEMVQSGNEPQKMKEATERVQSTLFGFIFVLVVSGVINYLIKFLGDVIK